MYLRGRSLIVSGSVRPPTDPSSGSRAVAFSVVSVLLFATFAAIPHSPFQPLLPPGYERGGPFVWFAKLIRADSLSGNPLVATGVLVTSLAVISFLLLLREAWRGNISLRTVLILVACYHVVVLFLPLLFSRDVYSYAFYGRIVGIYHGNPYVNVPLNYSGDPLWSLVGPKWVDTSTVYGPLFSMMAGGLARVFNSPSSQVDAYRIITVAASLGTVFVTAWTTRLLWPSRAAFAVVAFGANPVLLFHSVASEHNDLLVALSIAVALALLARGKELPAIAVLTLGATVKATGVLPLVVLLVWCIARREPNQRARAALTHVGLAVAIGLAISLPFMQRQDPTLGMLKLADNEAWLAPSLFFHQLLDAATFHHFGWLARVVFAGLFIVCFAALVREVVRRSRSLSPIGIGAAWGWALIFLMLLGPVLLPWYVVWAMPLVWLMPRSARWALIGTGVGLAMTQWSTEIANFPNQFSVEAWFGHWMVVPIILGALAWVLVDFRKRIVSGEPLESSQTQTTIV
jgi:alpha-1,6-mannosyltransferase